MEKYFSTSKVENNIVKINGRKKTAKVFFVNKKGTRLKARSGYITVKGWQNQSGQQKEILC